MILFFGVMIKINAFFLDCFYANSERCTDFGGFCCFVGHNCGLCGTFFRIFFIFFFIYFCKSLLPKMSNDVTHHLLVRKRIKSIFCWCYFYLFPFEFFRFEFIRQHLEFDVVVPKVVQKKKIRTSHPIISHRIAIQLEVTSSQFGFSYYLLTFRYVFIYLRVCMRLNFVKHLIRCILDDDVDGIRLFLYSK